MGETSTKSLKGHHQPITGDFLKKNLKIDALIDVHAFGRIYCHINHTNTFETFLSIRLRHFAGVSAVS